MCQSPSNWSHITTRTPGYYAPPQIMGQPMFSPMLNAPQPPPGPGYPAQPYMLYPSPNNMYPQGMHGMLQPGGMFQAGNMITQVCYWRMFFCEYLPFFFFYWMFDQSLFSCALLLIIQSIDMPLLTFLLPFCHQSHTPQLLLTHNPQSHTHSINH